VLCITLFIRIEQRRNCPLLSASNNGVIALGLLGVLVLKQHNEQIRESYRNTLDCAEQAEAPKEKQPTHGCVQPYLPKNRRNDYRAALQDFVTARGRLPWRSLDPSDYFSWIGLAATDVAGYSRLIQRQGILIQLLSIVSFLAAAILILHNFDFGFRATADEREYTYRALAWSPYYWVQEGVNLARGQGRIGFVFVIPLQFFGGWIGDIWFYPFLCVGILITIFLAFYVWIQFLTESKVALALSAVYLALLPAGLHHWLPNAYPFQFLPLAVGLLCRLIFQRLYGAPNFGLCWKGALAVGIFAGAISYELSFILLMTMAATEVVAYLFTEKSSPKPIAAGYLVWQGGILAAALVSFLLYRFFNPSIYAGNQVSTDTLSNQATVTLLHLYNAMSLDSIWMADWRALMTDGMRVAEAVIVLIGLSTVIATSRPEVTHWPRLIMLGGVTAIATTIPVALNHKYIDWCVRGGECTYIDARFSLLGLGLIVFSAACGLLPRNVFRAGFAAVVGLIGAMTFLVNANVRTNLQSVKAADSAAKAYVCEVGNQQAGDAKLIERLMMLDKAPPPATFHPKYDDSYKVKYWNTYLKHLRHSSFWLCG
jgi:hypothetical protein